MTTLTASRRMPLRAAAICELLAPVTVSIGWIGARLRSQTLTAPQTTIYRISGRRPRTWLGSTTRLGTPHRDPDHLARPRALACAQSGCPGADRRRRGDAHRAYGVPRGLPPTRLPRDRRWLHERFVALLGAQDEQSLYRRGDNRSAAHPRVRLPTAPAVARPVASDAPHCARLGGRGRSLQRHRQRRVGTRFGHHLVPLDLAPSVAADAPRGRENGQTECGSDLNAARTMSNALEGRMLVYAVVDDALSPDFPLGVELEVFVLQIEERELDAGGLN